MAGWKHKLAAAVLAIAIYAVIDSAVRDTAPWQEDPVGSAGYDAGLDGIVGDLFDKHVLAFEALGVLLTAAMIGALVISRPLGQVPDRRAYMDVSPEELEHSQDVSDTGVAPAGRSAMLGPAAVTMPPILPPTPETPLKVVYQQPAPDRPLGGEEE